LKLNLIIRAIYKISKKPHDIVSDNNTENPRLFNNSLPSEILHFDPSGFGVVHSVKYLKCRYKSELTSYNVFDP